MITACLMAVLYPRHTAAATAARRFVGHPIAPRGRRLDQSPRPERGKMFDRAARGYTAGMIALWTNWVTLQKAWLRSLRELPAGARPNPQIVAMMSQGSLASDADMPKARAALDALRAFGVKAIPACATLAGDYGHNYESWFDSKLWARMAETLARWAQARTADDTRVAIDLEAYWDREPRYPKHCEPNGTMSNDEYRLAVAMAPFIAMIKHEGITPWLLPGGMEVLALWHIAAACPDAVLLDEATYSCPTEPRAWINYENRKPAIEALRRGYLPGFYGRALRSPAFQAELQRRGIGDYWIFFRADDHENRFWEPGWAQQGNASPADTPAP
jgi:hypothetical protein